jgi:hypothetical protein
VAVSIEKDGVATKLSELDIKQLRELASNFGVEGIEEMNELEVRLAMYSSFHTILYQDIKSFSLLPKNTMYYSSLFRLTNVIFGYCDRNEMIRYLADWARDGFKTDYTTHNNKMCIKAAEQYNNTRIHWYGRVEWSDHHHEYLDMNKKNDENMADYLNGVGLSSNIDLHTFLLMTPEQCEVGAIQLFSAYKAIRNKVVLKVTNSHKMIKFLYKALNDVKLWHVVGDDAAYYFTTCLLRSNEFAFSLDKVLQVKRRIVRSKLK